MFNTCFSAAEPQKAVQSYVAFLKATPKRESLAGHGTVFGASGLTPPAAGEKKSDLSLLGLLSDMGASNFSADDLKLGQALLAGMNGK
jgi:hypothetical protein